MEWSLIVKLIVVLLLVSFLYSCFGKKKTSDGLEAWLDTHFKGRLKIVSTRTSDPIKHLSFKVKNSVVASTDDSLLQFTIRWDKRADNLGISLDEVNAMLATAKVELEDARDLLNQIKKSDLSALSCGIYNGNVRILFFAEPTPQYRIQLLEKLIPILEVWPKAKTYALALDIMEPKELGKELGDIIPAAHWERGDSWQLRNSIVTIRLDAGYTFDVKAINQVWQFNTESDRLLQWIEQSRNIASIWAKEHLKKPHQLLSQAQYSALEKQLGAQIQIPFSYSTKAEDSLNIDGYITGDFLLDVGTIGPLILTKE